MKLLEHNVLSCQYAFIYIHLSITFADVAKQVLDRCVVSNPETRDPKNKDFEVVLDYSFVEDQDGDAR